MKFTQPPLLRSLFHDPPLMWTSYQEAPLRGSSIAINNDDDGGGFSVGNGRLNRNGSVRRTDARTSSYLGSATLIIHLRATTSPNPKTTLSSPSRPKRMATETLLQFKAALRSAVLNRKILFSAAPPLLRLCILANSLSQLDFLFCCCNLKYPASA